MKQFRVRSQRCSSTLIESQCEDDYQSSNEETRSFYPGWLNQTINTMSNRSIEKAFQYQTENIDDDHGYLYEFRGHLRDLQSNASELHRYQWIDQQTRVIVIQMYLYNANVELFTSISVLVEFFSTGSLHPQIVIDPIHFYRKTMIFALLGLFFYFLRVIIAFTMDLYHSNGHCCRLFHRRRMSIMDTSRKKIFEAILVMA